MGPVPVAHQIQNGPVAEADRAPGGVRHRLRDLHDRMHPELLDIQEARDAGERLFLSRIAMRSRGNEEPFRPVVEEIEQAQVGE